MHPTSYLSHIPFIPRESTLHSRNTAITLRIPGQGHGWGKNWVIPWIQNFIIGQRYQVFLNCYVIYSSTMTCKLILHIFGTYCSLAACQPGQVHHWCQGFARETRLWTGIWMAMCLSLDSQWITLGKNKALNQNKTTSNISPHKKITNKLSNTIDTHPFRAMSIGHPIPEIRLFQNLIMKIQGQGNGWGEHWKSQYGSDIRLAHTPFVSCPSAIPFLRYDCFKS